MTSSHYYRVKVRHTSYKLTGAVKWDLRVKTNTLYNSSRGVEMDFVITAVLLRPFGIVTGLKCVIHLTVFAKAYNSNYNYVTNVNFFIFCATAQSFGTS